MVAAPRATGPGDQEPAQTSVAEADHRVRIGVTGQELQRRDAVIRTEHRIPSRPEELDECIESGVDGDPAFDHGGALLDQAPQRVCRSLAGILTQAFGMKKWQPGQQLGVDPIVLGVLGVVLAKIRRLGGGNHHHAGPAAAEPLRHNDPRVARRLDHDRQITRISQIQVIPQPFQLRRPGRELTATPHRDSVAGQRPLMRCPHCHVDPQRQCHCRFAPVSPILSSQVTDHRGHGPDIL
ncbi:Uncharacterised protein [Mycobacteroides abscessus subsp. abscessus]|nr:Uncharacterised protein [Mycobacteroides abscessus subsp. abscessus]